MRYNGQLGFAVAEYDSRKVKNLKHLGRILVYFFLMMFAVALGWSLLLLIQLATDSITTIEVYVFKVFLPNLFGGFVCFAFGDTICLRLGLYDKSSIYASQNDYNIQKRITADSVDLPDVKVQDWV